MRIKTKIMLSAAVSFMVSAVILLFVYAILREIEHETERIQVYREIRRKTEVLNLSIAQFPGEPNAGRIGHIEAIRESLQQLLETLEPAGKAEELLIHQIRASAHELRFALEKFIASSGAMAGAMWAERQNVLSSQLLMKTQFISDDAQRLMDISQSEIDAAQQQARILILALIAALILINIVISLVSGRSIIDVQESLHHALHKAGEGDRLLAALMAYVPEGIIMADAVLNVTRSSRYGEALLHILQGGQTAQGATAERENLMAVFKDLPLLRVVEGGEILKDVELVIAKADGEESPLLCTAGPIRDNAGAVIGCIVVWRDITEIKRAEKKLRQAMETSEALNRISEVLHSTLDFDEILQRIVAEGSALLGSESATVSLVQGGRWFVSQVHPPHFFSKRMKDQGQHSALGLGSHQPVAVEDAFNDERFDVAHMRRYDIHSVLVAPLVIRGQAVGVVSFNYHRARHRFTSTEVDFARQMANIAGIALSNARLFKELEESNQQLNEYGYALTHNIKAPLRAIQNYTNFLVEDLAETLGGEPRKYLDGLGSAVRQGHDQIEDLETLYRIKDHAVCAEPFALQELFDEMRSIFQDSPDRQLIAAQQCPRIWGERFLLRQILIELIRNGFKFNRAETKRVEVGCQGAAGHNGIEIFVRDNGIGIAPQYQEQIFRIFQRLHTASEYEGTGIGLAIVKRAVQKMGGTLRVESAPGEGSHFIICLPMAMMESDRA